MSERNPIRVGLIGAGGIGRVHMARYAHVEGAVLSAVCDPDSRVGEAAASAGAPFFANIREMIQNVELDAVDICTPTAYHADPAIQSIAAGLHVLCEKPLAVDPVSARAIVKAAREKGVLLMNAFCHRFHPPIAALKQAIDAGELGKVVMFRNRFAGRMEGVEDMWFSRKEISGGGAFLDTSIHSVDLFRFLVGEVVSVHAVMRRTNPAVAEVEDTAIALLSTADHRMGVVESSWSLEGGYNVVEVYGTDGAAMVHYWDGLKSRIKTRGSKEWKPLPEGGPDRFAREIQHFVDACGGSVALSVTGEDGLRALEIASDAYRSAGF